MSTNSADFDAEARRRKAELAKPMAAAPMRFNDDGSVAWDDMWDSFCVLASAGGPAHRAAMLEPDTAGDARSSAYQAAVSEIVRGIALVSGLSAAAADQVGWVRVQCTDSAMSAWLAEQITLENVRARAAGDALLVPVGAAFTVKQEIKNVVTVVAKTTHYWQDHIAAEMKSTLALEGALKKAGAALRAVFGRKTT
jgi:sirohydrochlorin cobaltochelatase